MKKIKLYLICMMCGAMSVLNAQNETKTVLKIYSVIESTFSDVKIDIQQNEDVLDVKINSGKFEVFDVSFFDESGKLLLRKSVTEECSIDMSKYESGKYMLKVSNNLRGLIRSFQVVKK